MAQEKFKRKLTTIFSADVAGYSRLMGEDEAATIRTLEQYKEILSELIRQHRGRVVDSPGDNLLAEFTSVVDGVQCAVAAQNEFKARNADLPENRKMQFRIGINLGDVIEEGDRIYGDGVNIAARLEALSDPGGICVSKTAFDHIETKLPLGYEFLGEQEVKNIAKPVGAYKVLMEPRVISAKVGGKSHRKRIAAAAIMVLVLIIGAGIWAYSWRSPRVEPASSEKMVVPLPDVPSIAVLPFTSIGNDPTTDLLSDGIMENLINGLSKMPRLLVIARTSTAAYKGQTVKVKQVSEDLGVQYVLEGSVQRSGDRIRITTQLVDALDGRTFWTERYDRELADVFALQDEITIGILASLRLKFGVGELSAIVQKHHKGEKGLECYLKELESDKHVLRMNPEDNAIALRLAEEAVAQCPESPTALTALGWAYHHSVYLGGPVSRSEAIERSIGFARKALEIDNSLYNPHSLLAGSYVLRGEFDKAFAEAETAVSLNPGSTDALNQYAFCLNFLGRYTEAIRIFERVIRLNPYGKTSILRGYGTALLLTGRFDDAVVTLKKAVQRSPEDMWAHIQLARAYSMMGKDKEAHAEVAEILKLDPKYSLETFVKTLPPQPRDRAERETWVNALRKAGLPEKPISAKP